MDELPVRAFLFEQFAVRPLLHDSPILHHEHQVGALHRRDAVGNDERRPPTLQPFVPGPQIPGGGLPPWGELVERLAWYFDTDGIQTGYCEHSGTKPTDMHQGIQDWLESETFPDGSTLDSETVAEFLSQGGQSRLPADVPAKELQDFLRQLALTQRAAARGRELGLDQVAATRAKLEWGRLVTLAGEEIRARIEERFETFTMDEARVWFDANQGGFQQARQYQLSVIVVDPENTQLVGSCGLSSVPTKHRLQIRGRALFTWCAEDAVGIPAALAEDARIDSNCRHCGTQVSIDMVGGQVNRAEPPDPRLWVRPLEPGRSLVGYT